MIKRLFLLLFVMMFIAALGCSSVNESTVTPPGSVDTPVDLRDSNSGRISWGTFGIEIDVDTMSAEIVPLRTSQIHYEITYVIEPPYCIDCIDVVLNGIDNETQVVDADITLTNNMTTAGYDVRIIIQSTPAEYELINGDDWTMRFDVPGGSIMNPFIAYAKAVPQRKFPIGATHTENFQIWLQDPFSPPFIVYTISACWPDNAEEPYSIDNFQQEGVLTGELGSSTNVFVDAFDWQDDVNKVTLVAPLITGQNFVQLNHISGNTWGMTLYNGTGADPGDYSVRMIATSLTSPGVALYDFFTITIS